MIYREIVENQLYVYMNGSLLYKRYIWRGYGMIFCHIWGSRNFSAKDVDNLRLRL